MKQAIPGDLLKTINDPSDLRLLDSKNLELLSEELRDFIIQNAALNGGHFAASLGVVELTIALHYIFNTPEDRIIWDVGHQAYGHKILTGRREQFHTNRKKDGLCGFTKRSESEYDTFVAGHASNSISAALGMSVASELKQENRHQIAVIGDGALTGGMAFEAMNHAGDQVTNMLVVLNDNQISIDPNVGALKNYLVNLTASQPFNAFRNQLKRALKKQGKLGKSLDSFAYKIEKSLKHLVFSDANLFEAFNFRYFGPIDGHDVERLTKVLEEMKRIKGPKLLHVITQKGKGFLPAEKDQIKWHATTGFKLASYCPDTGKMELPPSATKDEAPKYQDVFGKTIIELAEKDTTIVGVTPAMPSGCSLNQMLAQMPNRAFDVGICEQHAVTFSAGMAVEGLTPFCNIYSSFAQRAYDQIIHDTAIEKTPVVFCLDRGGLVGEDGETHHGVFDISYLRCVPNLVVSAPMNESELRNLMYTASKYKEGPWAIRYPRGKGVLCDWETPMESIRLGAGRCLKKGDEVAVLSFGHPGNFVADAIEIFEQKNDSRIGHYDMRFAKPLDEKLLSQIVKQYEHIITVEDGVLMGGFGSAVLEWLADNGHNMAVTRLGVPDSFIQHAKVTEQYIECGFDTDSILKALEDLV